jgi:hypothetical protein
MALKQERQFKLTSGVNTASPAGAKRYIDPGITSNMYVRLYTQ